jgi:hypothetical protein
MGKSGSRARTTSIAASPVVSGYVERPIGALHLGQVKARGSTPGTRTLAQHDESGFAGFKGEFIEAHELDAARAKKVPARMIGRSQSGPDAAELLDRLA